MEVQLRRDRAQLAVLAYLSGYELGKVIFGILSYYLNFVDRTKDTNKSRWPTSLWWTKFLGEAEHLKLTLCSPDTTVERNRQWLQDQVAPSITMQLMANSSDQKNEFDKKT